MPEEELEASREMQELNRNPGWLLLRSKIREEIDQAVEELQAIEVEGRSLHDIGADFVRLQKLITGLKRPEAIIQEMLDEEVNE